MQNQEKPLLKIRVQQEMAYEIIYRSLIIIFIGIAYLFGSNLLTFNWYTILFGVLAIIMIYLKYKSYLKIDKDTLTMTLFKYKETTKIDMESVTEIVFYNDQRRVEIKSGNKTLSIVYLKMKYKKQLLNYIMANYSDVACIVNN